VKFADFVDNAMGLPHNNVAGNERLVSRLAVKYLPLVDVFTAEFAACSRLPRLVSRAGLDTIAGHLGNANARLTALV
jgi:hypothetical protein